MSAERPLGDLTERQRAILVWLLKNDGPKPPSAIAYGIGMDKLPPVKSKGYGTGKGRGHRTFNPAQRIIGSLNGLSLRNMVRSGPRVDDLTGSAFSLTEWGRGTAEAILETESKGDQS